MKTRYQTLIAVLFAGTAFAASAQWGPGRGPAPFEAYDQNQDGAITSQELTAFRNQRQSECIRAARAKGMGNRPEFETIDLNGDGVISREELSKHQDQMWQRPMGNQAPMQRGMGRNMPTFQQFDLNGDGTLTEQEFIEARNNRIAERAKQGYMMRGLANSQPFSAIDRNNDGLVDEKEFLNMQEQHRQLRVK